MHLKFLTITRINEQNTNFGGHIYRRWCDVRNDNAPAQYQFWFRDERWDPVEQAEWLRLVWDFRSTCSTSRLLLGILREVLLHRYMRQEWEPLWKAKNVIIDTSCVSASYRFLDVLDTATFGGWELKIETYCCMMYTMLKKVAKVTYHSSTIIIQYSNCNIN